VTAPLLTYFDMIEDLIEFARARGKSPSQLAVRGAIHDAYEEIATMHRWSFAERLYRLQLHAAETTGTVVYDHTGGTYERQLTLTGATWPAWAVDACVKFDNLVCDIAEWKSETVVTLDSNVNPGQDVASTTYRLYPRYYRLPEDFISFTTPLSESSWQLGTKVTMSEIAARDRYSTGSGRIEEYAVGEAPDLYGRLALFVYPASSADETLDLMIRRRPRDLRYSGHDANDFVGTITVEADSEAVAGTTTAFESGHVNSILRISRDTNRPTGRRGGNPYAEERAIAAVDSTTAATLDGVVATSREDVKYVITDPIDLGRSAHQLFRRLCEKHLALAANFEHTAGIATRADRALWAAMEADEPTERDPVQEGRNRQFLDGDVNFS